MALSMGTAEMLSYKLHIECLGRKPTKADRIARAKQIIEKGKELGDDYAGVLFVHATLYESDEAKIRQAEDSRIRKLLLVLADERGIK